MLTCRMSSDPLPPKDLEVKTDAATTTSVKVTWKRQTSHIVKWQVKYRVTDTDTPTYVYTSSVTVLEQTISGLKAGQKYIISVYGVTTGGKLSQDATSEKEATVSE